ncbi:cytochrome c oxidase subunit II [Devosia nitrariae]|uniref:Cytochrome c oxidase subunit II n=1 Tax=Devosia nitrariae TaxID=2071872 RepID=A0ABQ5W6C7_9HYPH|nr:c-type cytochrome [Devosia nitrariae]GLQ55346.1 cytochrome c oxidase subunit II [Devosia nitrariae]
MTAPVLRSLAGTLCLLALAGCAGEQSAFFPRGAEAERIETLFWVMTIAGSVIFIGVVVATGVAMLGGQRVRRVLAGERFIAGAGIAFPVAALSILLVAGFLVMRAGAAGEDAEGGLRIAVSGERWWWRVTYLGEDGTQIESANELHLPVGEPVTLELTTADVIHSFWAPQLAGKLDMIPGRINRLTLTATEPGVSRGQCAEYCGGAHAFMSFQVVAQPPEDFADWMANEAADAPAPQGESEARGAELFRQAGCGACHTVRGAGANGRIGPDLTHVGSRRSLAAATLPNDAEAFARWITDNQHIKPENQMPPYTIFDEAELEDLSNYLESLK